MDDVNDVSGAGRSDTVVFVNGMGWTKAVTDIGIYVVLVKVRVTRGLETEVEAVKLEETWLGEEEQGTSGPAPPRRHAVAVDREEGVSIVTELETSMFVLEGTNMPVGVALTISSVVDGDAVPDAVANTASRLASSAS